MSRISLLTVQRGDVLLEDATREELMKAVSDLVNEREGLRLSIEARRQPVSNAGRGLVSWFYICNALAFVTGVFFALAVAAWAIQSSGCK